MQQNSILRGAATSVLEFIGKRLWGFKPRLMQDFVDQHGSGRAVYWFARNMPKYEKILKTSGPLRTHLLASAISIMNGCKYCHAGHADAFQLHYLQKYDRLFPLDTNQMFHLREHGNEAAMDKLIDATIAADLENEIPTLRRLIALYHDPSLTKKLGDDALIHLISMFKVLNQCGIDANTEPDAIHDPINRDTILMARYKSLRDQYGKAAGKNT